MKTLAPTAAALALLLGSSLAQDPPQTAPIDARVEALEAEVEALQKEMLAQKALLDQTSRYLAGAQQRSAELLKTFDEAEKAGFTAGINFTSREILLAGMRAYARGEAEGVPGVEEKKAEPPRRRY